MIEYYRIISQDQFTEGVLEEPHRFKKFDLRELRMQNPWARVGILAYPRQKIVTSRGLDRQRLITDKLFSQLKIAGDLEREFYGELQDVAPNRNSGIANIGLKKNYYLSMVGMGDGGTVRWKHGNRNSADAMLSTSNVIDTFRRLYVVRFEEDKRIVHGVVEPVDK